MASDTPEGYTRERQVRRRLFSLSVVRPSGRTVNDSLPPHSRSQQSLQAIRALVSAFPASNDSSALRDESVAQSSDVDINAQLGALRSKYRTSCALVGMRPRMAVSVGSDGPAQKAEDNLRSLGSTM